MSVNYHALCVKMRFSLTVCSWMGNWESQLANPFSIAWALAVEVYMFYMDAQGWLSNCPPVAKPDRPIRIGLAGFETQLKK